MNKQSKRQELEEILFSKQTKQERNRILAGTAISTIVGGIQGGMIGSIYPSKKEKIIEKEINDLTRRLRSGENNDWLYRFTPEDVNDREAWKEGKSFKDPKPFGKGEFNQGERIARKVYNLRKIQLQRIRKRILAGAGIGAVTIGLQGAIAEKNQIEQEKANKLRRQRRRAKLAEKQGLAKELTARDEMSLILFADPYIRNSSGQFVGGVNLPLPSGNAMKIVYDPTKLRRLIQNYRLLLRH